MIVFKQLLLFILNSVLRKDRAILRNIDCDFKIDQI